MTASLSIFQHFIQYFPYIIVGSTNFFLTQISSFSTLAAMFIEDMYVSPVRTFTARIHYTTFIELNHSYFPHVRKLHSDNFLQQIPFCGTLPEHVNLDLFKSRFNSYLTSLSSEFSLFTTASSIHIKHLILISTVTSVDWLFSFV